jgi:manganese transport protein
MNTNPFALDPSRRRPGSRPPRPGTWLPFVGSGALVAVGYMDPGNWATALAGGASYGYTLLSVVVMSSLMAMLLQWVSSRLGVVTGRDLAQLCRERTGRRTTLFLWVASEIAIIACDVAEVVGSAVALQLLFGVSLTAGVLMSAVGTFAMLALQRHGHRTLETAVVGLILFVGLCFVIELVLARPDWRAALTGAVPSAELLRTAGMVWLSAGILGATVMPHNLYLHTAVVQSRAYAEGLPAKREAIRFASIDSTVALCLALLVNSAILITAAAVFHAGGRTEVAEIQEAYELLTPMVGTAVAATLFAVALLACGLNATVTATLAGQVVMEGFLGLQLPPVIRRLVTRLVAIVPAVIVTWFYGASGTAQLLILSQVVLCLQLPFAVVPLMLFASDRKRLGLLTAPRWQLVLGWAATVLILAMNLKLLWDVLFG